MFRIIPKKPDSPVFDKNKTPDSELSRAFCHIPTRVGNIISKLKEQGVDTVHPRARGEHIETLALIELAVGSPPRTQGTYFLQPNRTI